VKDNEGNYQGPQKDIEQDFEPHVPSSRLLGQPASRYFTPDWHVTTPDPTRGMIGRFVQSSRAGSSNRTAGAVETGGFRPPTYTLDWDEPPIVGP
jgi:hypothetical protein